MSNSALRVSALLVAVVAVLCLIARVQAGEATPEEEAIKPGDMVKVIKGPAPVKVEYETRTLVDEGTILKVEAVQAKWVKVTVNKDGKPVTGWIDGIKHLSRMPTEPADKIETDKGKPDSSEKTPVAKADEPSAEQGVSIEWGSDADKKNKGAYQLQSVSTTYKDGVSLRLKYKRVGTTDDVEVDTKGKIGIKIYFIRGAKDVRTLPGIKTGGVISLSFSGDWCYMGDPLVDPKTAKETGAFAFMEPPKNAPLPEASGEVTVPLSATDKVPLHGDGIIVVAIGDTVSWKAKRGVGFRQLSNAMALRIRFPANK